MLSSRRSSLTMLLFVLTFIIANAIFLTQAETTVALRSSLKQADKSRKLRLVSESRLLAAKLSTLPSVPKKPKRFAFIPDGIKNGIASYLATVLVKVILAPLDTIKTIQQIEIGNQLGIFSTAQHIIKTRGVGSLWAGTLVAAIGASPSVAMYFGVFSSLKLRFAAMLPPGSRSFAVGLAAAIANTFACVLRVPYEVMKARLQSGAAVNLLDALQQATSGVEGGLALFGGGKLMSQIIRDVPYAIFAAVCYDVLQTHFFNAKIAGQVNTIKQANNKGGVWQDMTCGAIAGGISTFLTTPMDVLKTRLMAGRQSYGSVNNAMAALLKEDGIAALFTGWQSRLLHKIPANALFFVAYEFFRVALGAVETRSEQ
jgi:solute carrier family 25 S-adenosylmethionine transporter 26